MGKSWNSHESYEKSGEISPDLLRIFVRVRRIIPVVLLSNKDDAEQVSSILCHIVEFHSILMVFLLRLYFCTRHLLFFCEDVGCGKMVNIRKQGKNEIEYVKFGMAQ